jgi:hypothetical protein
MSAVQLKLYLQPQGAIRRLTVDTNTTFEQFQAHVKSLYPQHVETLGFQYVDDEEDLVSFSSNNEWSSALINHVESKAGLLRVKVFPTAVRRPQPRPQCWPQRPRFFEQAPQHCQRRQPQEQDIEAYINRVAPFLRQFGIEVEREEKPEKKQEAVQSEEEQVEAFISKTAPLLKQLFGIDIEIEREKVEQPVVEKKEVPVEQPEEEIEEIIIPEDDEVVEQVYPSAPVVETKSIEQASVEVKFATELETLSNMGFTNEKLNKHLLENFNGDLVRVVNSLVQLSSKQ